MVVLRARRGSGWGEWADRGFGFVEQPSRMYYCYCCQLQKNYVLQDALILIVLPEFLPDSDLTGLWQIGM